MVQEYTKAQIKEHNSKSSVWVLIENDVYDVTPFLNEVIVFFYFISCRSKVLWTEFTLD